jgi:hypothetical protein
MAPARQEGLQQIQWYFLNPGDNGGKMKRVWIYQPGLRRVRLAPNASHDQLFAATGGNLVYSEQFLFSGLMDRFDFKLLGRKEVFIPYNNYNLNFHCSIKKAMSPHYINPDCTRWELHRVWVIKATLKPGKHSIYSKRMYYFDEDSYLGGLYDAWDQAGNLKRSGFLATVPFPKYHATEGTSLVFYNMKVGSYFINSIFTKTKYEDVDNRNKPLPESVFNPRSMKGRGVF